MAASSWSRPSSRRWLGLLVLVTALAMACSDGDESSVDGDADPRSSSALVLESPGAEPRVVLAAEPAVGDTWENDIDVRQELSDAVGRQVVSVSVTMRDEVIEVDDDEFTVRSELTRAVLGADAVSDPATEAALEALVGSTETQRRNLLGEVLESDVATAGSLGFLGEADLAGLALTVPSEAVGIGGRWSVTSQLSLAEVSLDAVRTYEVVGLSDDEVALTIEVTGAVAGDGQIVDIAGQGSITLDRSTLAARSASLDTTVETGGAVGSSSTTVTRR